MRDKDMDWLKGWAIIFVILIHSISHALRFQFFEMFTIGQSVPIFILISGFVLSKKVKNSAHIFKEYFSKYNIVSLFFNIIFPALLISITQFFLLKPNLLEFLKQGASLGPGSYYIVVYFQIWWLIPFLVLFYQRVSSLFLQMFIIILIQIIGFSLITDPNIYRLSALRYIFLLYIGVLLQVYIGKNSDVSFKTMIFSLFSGSLRWVFISLSLLSGILLYFIYYKNFRSILFPKYWVWASYGTDFYTLLFVCFMLKCLEYLNKIEIFSKISNLISYLGKCSFEIYLMQLVFFSFHDIFSTVAVFIPVNFYNKTVLYPLISIIFSCTTGVLFNKVKVSTKRLLWRYL